MILWVCRYRSNWCVRVCSLCYIMHSLWLTGRLLSRAIWNGISNLSTAADPNIQRKPEPHFVSAVCGFSKERRRIHRLLKGQFGDDAWFTAKCKSADVLGTFSDCIRYLSSIPTRFLACFRCSGWCWWLEGVRHRPWRVFISFNENVRTFS